jgi:hypothetical protein
LDVVQSDGFIAIENGGELTVYYNETTPSHSSVAVAATDVSGPAISDVYVSDITNNAAIVHWTTNVPSTSQVYYGSTPALGSVTPLDTDMVLAHSVVVSGLTNFQDYYFDVESVSIGGVTTRDTNGGDHYMFTTVDDPDVLIVQEHSDVESSDQQVNDWRLSLDYYGWSFVVWETVKYGLPSVAALNTAKVVYWDVGEGYPQLGTDERAVLQAWVDQPGMQRWYQTGQDVGWDMCDAAGTDRDNAWFEAHLHSRYRRDDADGGGGNEGATPFQIIGTAHPITSTFPGAGAGLDLEQDVYGASRFWPDDLTNDRGGEVPAPWVYNRNAGGGDSGGSAYEGSDFKCAYEGFAHAMIQEDDTYGDPGHVFGVDLNLDRATIADETIQWLFGEDHPDITVNYPNGGETVSGVVNIQWSYGAAAPLTVNIQISRDGGQSYVEVATGLPALPANWNWDTTTGTPLDFPNGEFYRVKVVGYGAQLQGFDVSDANFTVQNGGGDDIGPAIWAGSVTPDPIPVARGTDLNVTAIADDRYKGNSNIAEAELYMDGTAPGDLIGPMGGNFYSSPLEMIWADVPIHAGYSLGGHTLYVRAMDSYNNWGGFESIDFYVVAGPPAPPTVDLTYPDSGVAWMGGSAQTLFWNMSDNQDAPPFLTVDITYSTDGGTTFPFTIATGLTGFPSMSCSYLWNPVDTIDSQQVRYRIEVWDLDANYSYDDSVGDNEIDSTPPAESASIWADLEGLSVRVHWTAPPDLDVVLYEVWWRMNGFDPTGNTYTSSFTVTPPTTDVLHANVGINNPQTYTYQLRTFDHVGHETRTTIQAAKFGSTQSVFTRDPDWFMLGNPLGMGDTTIGNVIQGQGLPANWQCIRKYDGATDTWATQVKTCPINDITHINTNEGFWMYISSSTRFATAGWIEDKSIQLYNGWNLVAYPFGARSMNTAAIEAHLIANCPGYMGMLVEDLTDPYHLKVPTGTETIFHNMGFWVQVNADTTWTVLNY